MDIEETIYKYALTNAVEHGNKCQTGSVIGMVMSKHPEMRKDPKTVSQLAGKLSAKVNGLSPEEQQSELEKYGGLEEHKRTQEKPKGLPELENAEKGKVTLRFAPNPSGPLHIGHARAALLNMLYQKKYDGKLILRIEDTDPKRVEPDAYTAIPEDVEWLGIKPDEVYIQSDRLEIYYEYARKAIEIGAAYMCTCDAGEFKKLKDNCQPCPCRSHTIEENMELWDKFEDMEEGEAVLRVKTDIKHKNPAIRDWVAMRIVDQEHPRLGNKYRIYPMMNFSVTVDDHLMGMTHVLRGKDHLANSEKQSYLYKHFGWKIPEFIHYGRLKMDDVLLSTSKAREGIANGKYTGWDDPRLGTIRAIARRGIKKEALYELIEEIGTKQADATISWKKIYGLNRKIIEENTNRYFFIPNPVKVDVKDLPEDKQSMSVTRELHYNKPEKGLRNLNFNGSAYIPKDDYEKALDKKPLRLMDLINIDVTSSDVTYDSESLEEAQSKHASIIQWVPVEDSIKAKVVMPDNTIVDGFIEKDSSDVKVDDIVQLERFGFARVDEVEDDEITFYYTHN
ncbi:glutamate--tRNA ligase [Methanosphaera sp. Vir-13MRS]|uniref:glutamate--tRNA ligase n=1 Tax=Candidatus Methanosphaera massiliense TaxID=3017187 RepID=UPI0023801F69|nr:glutamate--tRNA ligase [Candidatus Methanosphaera massiliense]MDE4078450.1 glutamate--tRNA ligase [Candidatus Methanosphaera massiliense]